MILYASNSCCTDGDAVECWRRSATLRSRHHTERGQSAYSNLSTTTKLMVYLFLLAPEAIIAEDEVSYTIVGCRTASADPGRNIKWMLYQFTSKHDFEGLDFFKISYSVSHLKWDFMDLCDEWPRKE